MYTKNDYTEVMSRSDGEWPKYGGNPLNVEKVINYQLKNQFIPSKVSLLRAIRELGIKRTDGGSIQSDALAAQAKAQKNFDNVVAEVQQIPLSQEEFREFGSLSQLE
jgi:hypothetical protein